MTGALREENWRTGRIRYHRRGRKCQRRELGASKVGLEAGISHQISVTSPGIVRNISGSKTEDRHECGSQGSLCLFLKLQLRKEAFLMTLGRQCLYHPRESARKSAGWALSKKGVTWEQGTCLQREPVGVACPPWPMSCAAFTCHNPGQALAAPLWDPGCRPSLPFPSPSRGPGRGESPAAIGNGWTCSLH